MDSKLEAHIDEIFIDVPKTDKMVTMINRIKSKANSKFLQIRDQGYSRSVAFNEVDDWLMKAKVIVDEEAGKLTPAELATIKTLQLLTMRPQAKSFPTLPLTTARRLSLSKEITTLPHSRLLPFNTTRLWI